MNVDELRAAMRALSEPVTDKQPPHWEYWRHELWRHVVNGDDPAHFWEWPCVYHTMLQNHWLPLIETELQEIADTDIPSSILRPPANGVFDYLADSAFSANLIKQYYHLMMWQRVTGKRIEDLSTIVDFGAGYGALALLVHRLGFKGTYYIIDLPEFSLLQQYYLSNTGEAVNAKWPGEYEIPAQLDLLIALYSLSETPYALRDGFLDNLQAQSHLFLYSNRFADFDNIAYFDNYAKRRGGNWQTWKIEHMPPESWYSVGWKE